MITIIIHDEINVEITGLPKKELTKLMDRFSYTVPGSFMWASVKTGNSNGKESFIDEDGFTFSYLVPQIVDYLEDNLGYDVDEFEIEDGREDINLPSIDHVDDTFLMEETGRTLRQHQVDGINTTIDKKRGTLEFATNSGKSLLALGISKVFDPYMKSIVIVPSETLVKQTYEDYARSELSCIALSPKIKPHKRQEEIDKHRHIIITAKLLLNCLEMLHGDPYVLIVDEIHSYFGDRFSDALRFELSNCPVRIGLTGTYPKDKYKREKIACHMGDGVIGEVSNDYLIKNKHSSTVDIKMISTRHPELEELSEESEQWDWDTEASYLRTHVGRIGAIADYIKTLEPTNTLVLCRPQLGVKLASHFNDKMITDNTPTDQRQKWFSEFEESEDPVFLCASFGTGATGISQNRIFRLILIDVGKNNTYIKQSIGRGLRLDGELNHIDVIDISATTKYSKKHKKDRIKVYKQEKFWYSEEDNEIIVEE